MSGASGRYSIQPGAYRAFMPNPLPLDPPPAISGEMHMLLSKADRALGRLDGSIQSLPHPDLFVFMYVRKEAVLSSQIEGTQASIGDLLEAEARIFNPEQPDDVGEVINYVRAMNHGLGRLPTLPMSLRLVREMHGLLVDGVRGQNRAPGEFRTTQNWIGAAGSTIGEATFVPPPPQELPRLLGNLEGYLHQDDPIPLLLKIGIAHAQFETLHPFLDGNGRIGRLLITLLLCEKQVLIKPVLYLSHYFKRHRQAYYDALQATRDEADWQRWLKFFVTGVFTVANEATETARRIVEMREGHRQQLVDHLGRGAGNGLRLLESLYLRPIFSITDVAALLDLTHTAASSLTERFVEHGMVEEITGNRRNRRFSYRPYIHLFSE